MDIFTQHSDTMSGAACGTGKRVAVAARFDNLTDRSKRKTSVKSPFDKAA